MLRCSPLPGPDAAGKIAARQVETLKNKTPGGAIRNKKFAAFQPVVLQELTGESGAVLEETLAAPFDRLSPADFLKGELNGGLMMKYYQLLKNELVLNSRLLTPAKVHRAFQAILRSAYFTECFFLNADLLSGRRLLSPLGAVHSLMRKLHEECVKALPRKQARVARRKPPSIAAASTLNAIDDDDIVEPETVDLDEAALDDLDMGSVGFSVGKKSAGVDMSLPMVWALDSLIKAQQTNRSSVDENCPAVSYHQTKATAWWLFCERRALTQVFDGDGAIASGDHFHYCQTDSSGNVLKTFDLEISNQLPARLAFSFKRQRLTLCFTAKYS